ncbi:MAG: hypothetical protein HQL34_06775 [Alphaproteobacteria bacterium]|nr:hypothetical protein [Alphaproteobacteria bacterium]
MNAVGTILMGAQRRLLPLWIPYRFFLAATLFHGLAWGLLAVAADQVAGYRGGPGPLLAMLHALTLGVLTMTAVGAALQILPVVTGQALRALWSGRVISWLYVPGVLLLLFGFHSGHGVVMEAGGAVVAVCLAVFIALVCDVLIRARGLFPVFRVYTWAALAGLAGLAILGSLAIADFRMGFLQDHAAVGLAHFLLAAFGFMGMLAMGFSHVLVPMFALAGADDDVLAKSGPVLAVLAVALGVAGALTGSPLLLAGAAVVGMGAAGVYLWVMGRALRAGMRKNLGLSFVLVKAAWAMLPLSLLAGGAAALGLGGERLVILFSFLALFGWLLTFLLGILQRIIPFLAAMNAVGWAMPRLSELAGETPLKVHAVCHFAALAVVTGGILSETALPIRVGALIGVAGAVSYVLFALDVVRRLAATGKTRTEKKNHV